MYKPHDPTDETAAPLWVYAALWLILLMAIGLCIVVGYVALQAVTTPTLTAPVGACVNPLCM